MSELKTLDLTKLHSDEIGHFGVQVRDILNDVMGTDHVACVDFIAAADAYHKATEGGTADSLSLSNADAAADRAWGAFYYQLQASIRSLNDDMRNAANDIQTVFEQTTNPTSLNYAAEYGALRILLERLEAIPSAKHALARTDLVLADLRKTYNDFIELSNAATLEASTRVYGVRKETRTAFVSAWKKLVSRLNVLVDLNHDDKAENAIQQINVLIDHYKNLIKQRSKATKAGGDV